MSLTRRQVTASPGPLPCSNSILFSRGTACKFNSYRAFPRTGLCRRDAGAPEFWKVRSSWRGWNWDLQKIKQKDNTSPWETSAPSTVTSFLNTKVGHILSELSGSFRFKFLIILEPSVEEQRLEHAAMSGQETMASFFPLATAAAKNFFQYSLWQETSKHATNFHP